MGKVDILAVEALMMPPLTKPGFSGGKLFMPLGSGLMTITHKVVQNAKMLQSGDGDIKNNNPISPIN